MTRSVGGVDRLERAECDTAVGGPVTGTDGTGEAAACSSASGTVGIGLAGASGRPGASQPHRTHGQPADTGTASSPQQDTCAAAQVEVGEQQERFPPGGQHDFAVGVKGAARSWDGTAGVRADVAQLQARAGAAVPIAVETASSTQTNGRTRLKIGMRASYTRSFARVNPIRPPVGQVPRRVLRTAAFIRDGSCERGTGAAGASRSRGTRNLADAIDDGNTRSYNTACSSSRGCPDGVCVIRIFATILVAVQALLPPGMCLCQLVPIGAVPHRAHESASASLPAAEVPCRSCAACRGAVPAATPPLADERAATDREAPHEHPLPTPPCSECPVVSAGPAARVAILPATQQAPLDPAVHFVVPTAETTRRHTARPHHFVAPTAPPLFLRHCAFLI